LLKRVLRISDFYTKQNGQWIQTGSDTELHPESMAQQQQAFRKLPILPERNCSMPERQSGGPTSQTINRRWRS
jgi:hypothetical protein